MKKVSRIGIWLALSFLGFTSLSVSSTSIFFSHFPTAEIEKIWSIQLGRSSDWQESFTPILMDKKLYLTNAMGTVVALNLQQGKIIWRVKLPEKILATPSVGAGKLVLSTAGAHLITLALNNGRVSWQADLSNESLAAPTIQGNKVAVKSLDGVLSLFAMDTGDLLWTHRHGAPNLVLRKDSSPLIIEGQVISGFSDGQLLAFSLSTGTVLWQCSLAAEIESDNPVRRMASLAATPVTDGIKIYVAGYQGTLAAIDRQSGEIIWQHPLSTYQNIAFTPEGQLYAVDVMNHVWAFHREDGKVNWQQPILQTYSLSAPLALIHTILIADNQGGLYWLAKSDGHVKAKYLNSSPVVSATVDSQHRLYLLSKNGELAAYRL